MSQVAKQAALSALQEKVAAAGLIWQDDRLTLHDDASRTRAIYNNTESGEVFVVAWDNTKPIDTDVE